MPETAPETAPDTAIGYIRVSTFRQAEDGESLDIQRERIEGYCKAQRLTLTGIVNEGPVSGTIPLKTRPEGSQLVSTSAQHIVATRLDRLFRSASDCLVQTEKWQEQKVSLHLIDMGGMSLNTGSSMSKVFLHMLAAFAEFERNQIRERTVAGLQAKKGRKGRYCRINPLGYDDVDDRLVPVDEEQDLISEIMGQHALGLSLRQIAGDLNRRGVPGKRGGKFYASTIRAIIQNSLHEELRTAA